MKKAFKILSLILAVLLCGGYFLSSKVIFPLKFEDSIKKYSNEYNINPYLLAAVISNESSFKELPNYSVNEKNGVIQVMDYTSIDWAKKMKINNFNPKDIVKSDVSINMAAWYLSQSYDKSNEEKSLKSWVTRNVREDKSNKLSDEEISRRVSLIQGRMKTYKKLHPFLTK